MCTASKSSMSMHTVHSMSNLLGTAPIFGSASFSFFCGLNFPKKFILPSYFLHISSFAEPEPEPTADSTFMFSGDGSGTWLVYWCCGPSTSGFDVLFILLLSTVVFILLKRTMVYRQPYFPCLKLDKEMSQRDWLHCLTVTTSTCNIFLLKKKKKIAWSFL